MIKDHCHYADVYRGAENSIRNLRCSVPTEIPVVFRNRFNYEYDFIIKELVEEFEKQFTGMEYIFEKYITSLVPIEKEVTRIDKIGKKIRKTLSYRLQLIDSIRCIANLLSNFANNLAEGIHKIKCKYGHDVKKREICGIRYKKFECFLEYTKFKDNLIKWECLYCNKNYQRKFDENLKKRFFDIIF